MNGYVETGYVVILGSLGTYAPALVSRANGPPGVASAQPRASRRPPDTRRPSRLTSPSHPTNASAVSRGAEEEGPL